MRRKRLELFFILYLTAAVAFVVVSKEREKKEDRIEKEKEEFLRSFLTQPGIEYENDTLFFYLDGENSRINDIVLRTFTTHITVNDVGAEDSARMIIDAVTHNDILISPSIVRSGDRSLVGDLEGRTVMFPLEVQPNSIGVYTIGFTIEAKRIHSLDETTYRYRDIQFPKEYIDRELLERMEQARGQFTLIVEDTASPKIKDVAELELAIENTSISTAVGFEVENNVTVNLGFNRPSVRVIKGKGKLVEDTLSNDRINTYIWKGKGEKHPYTVALEARVDREAGGKDISRATFTVEATKPYLKNAITPRAYSGEMLTLDLQVAGLEEPEKYTWEIAEQIGESSSLAKFDGSGPTVRYRIPQGFNGKTLRITAEYDGKPYEFIDPKSGFSSNAEFRVPVVEPPVHIEFDPPETMRLQTVYRFTAFKFHAQEFSKEQPVSDIERVRIFAKTETGIELQPNLRMSTPGTFELLLVSSQDLPQEGVNANIMIEINQQTAHKQVFIRP